MTDEVCTCGHVIEEHAADGTCCLVKWCPCGRWEPQKFPNFFGGKAPRVVGEVRVMTKPVPEWAREAAEEFMSSPCSGRELAAIIARHHEEGCDRPRLQVVDYTEELQRYEQALQELVYAARMLLGEVDRLASTGANAIPSLCAVERLQAATSKGKELL